MEYKTKMPSNAGTLEGNAFVLSKVNTKTN